MYINAMQGTAMNTERATSFFGLRHSSEKMEHWSKPLNAKSAIFVKTFSVTREKPGHASENATWESEWDFVQSLTSRYAMTRKMTIDRIEPVPLSHLVTWSPRTFRAKTSKQRNTVSDSVKVLLVPSHAPWAPAP